MKYRDILGYPKHKKTKTEIAKKTKKPSITEGLKEEFGKLDTSGVELGKIYTDKDRPPFKVNEASDKIQVQGIGVYDYDTLKKKLQKMSVDIGKIGKKGEWGKLAKNEIRAFAEMWEVISEYERKHK